MGNLFSPSEFESIAGRRFNPSTDFVGIMNGSWGDNNVVPCGAVYQSVDGIVYASWSSAPTTHSWVRINYVIVLGG